MDKDELQDLTELSVATDQDLEKRVPMTILFSDIKGSTRYAEVKGDVEYMAMIGRHNRLLFPIIEKEGGWVVKTIGDAILAKFDDPVAAVKAAAGMQRELAKDRTGREEIEQIRVRIGLHYGKGLVKDNDVFGDVVNAASRVEHQCQADHILITDTLIDAAKRAGFAYAKMGRAELKGKDEPLDLYAIAWSDLTTQQLIDDIQTRFEQQVKELRKEKLQLEQEFDDARDQWLVTRRALNQEIEALEYSVEQAKDTVRKQILDDLQSELRFQIEELTRSRLQLEEEFNIARQKFEAERNNLKAQIAAMEAGYVEAMARSNNPARTAMAVREQVESRLVAAKEEWELRAQSERKRLMAEIERLKKSSTPSLSEDKKAAARRAVLEKLGKLPSGPAVSAAKTADQWEREYEEAQAKWDAERDDLKIKVRKLEVELQHANESMRGEIFEEVRAQYESKINEVNRERQRLEQEIQSLTSDLAGERQRLNARIQSLEQTLPQAQEAARKQGLAELQTEFDLKVEQANRQRARLERHHQGLAEEWEADKRRAAREIADLKEQLKEAKEATYRAMKASGRTISTE
jgi:class 3 adenylate cyclase